MSAKTKAIFKAASGVQNRILNEIKDTLISQGKLIETKIVENTIVTVHPEMNTGLADSRIDLKDGYGLCLTNKLVASEGSPVQATCGILIYHNQGLVGQKVLDGTLTDQFSTEGFVTECHLAVAFMFDLIWLATMQKETECAKH